jgi:hypothetical protein
LCVEQTSGYSKRRGALMRRQIISFSRQKIGVAGNLPATSRILLYV